jgi:hypothetical protein
VAFQPKTGPSLLTQYDAANKNQTISTKPTEAMPAKTSYFALHGALL